MMTDVCSFCFLLKEENISTGSEVSGESQYKAEKSAGIMWAKPNQVHHDKQWEI